MASFSFLVFLFLFRSMAHGLADQRFYSYEEAKEWIDSWIGPKDMSFFRRGIHILPEKWEKVVSSDGQYFNWNVFVSVILNSFYFVKNSENLFKDPLDAVNAVDVIIHLARDSLSVFTEQQIKFANNLRVISPVTK